MKRINSLKRNEEIAVIVRKRVSVRNDCFIMYYCSNNLDHSRICLSVGKKIGIAVMRNKVKRQVREMLTGMFDLTKSVDYVIVVRNNYLENSFEVNKEKLLSLYQKLYPTGSE